MWLLLRLSPLLLLVAFPASLGADDALSHWRTDNEACWRCHDGRKSIKVAATRPDAEEDTRELTPTPVVPYQAGVHGKLACTRCHTAMTSPEPPHQSGTPQQIDCSYCHAALLVSRRAESPPPPVSRLEKVVANAEAYRQSFHARANIDYPEVINATCHECHDAHSFNVPTDRDSAAYAAWRAAIPDLCGKCHEEQREEYLGSIHGVALLKNKNPKAPTCIDCHSTHAIGGAHLADFKRRSPDTCGSCHPANLTSYRDTYHGQVTRMGFVHTAKCFDCHEAHKAFGISDPNSTVHPRNRLATCRRCHDGEERPLAPVGFLTFTPHAHDGDYSRYPEVWIASRFMATLFGGVALFFLVHSGLWFFREWKELGNGSRRRAPDRAASAPSTLPSGQHFRRFSGLWRALHLLFALAMMLMVLTGISLRFADTDWAPVVTQLLGGVEQMGRIHRLTASLLFALFFLHLLFLLPRLCRDPRFTWFGPDSLVPGWRDLTDCRAMFRWFLGKGERPRFDRWTYYEKFDYWAVFWGMTVMGASGLLLAFPESFGQYVEGWAFNVALLIHGEEAILATVFLFTVHFFNNHFRPSKLPPPNIVMFTGTEELSTWADEHPAHHERLLRSGNLEEHLVAAPTKTTTALSRTLGLALIGIGLTLLFLVLSGMAAH
ncbi:MAG: cytochrome C [Magnetococcales bacterium]|nr:cytochrome C [Magnetococcales bacterium]MBF0156540.1 cytochrome C [Magnetococcales bacterium]